MPRIRFACFVITILIIVSCSCSPRAADGTGSRSVDDALMKLSTSKNSVFRGAFVKANDKAHFVFLIELERDAVVDKLASQLPKDFERGWADYAGGKNEVLFRNREFEILIASEQACSKHTIVEVIHL